MMKLPGWQKYKLIFKKEPPSERLLFLFSPQVLYVASVPLVTNYSRGLWPIELQAHHHNKPQVESFRQKEDELQRGYWLPALSDILDRKLSAGDFLIPVFRFTRTRKSAAGLVPDKDIRNSNQQW
jgi:hypothetical protein